MSELRNVMPFAPQPAAPAKPVPVKEAMIAMHPSGRPMTVNDLPPEDTKRWVIRRKAEVVAAIRAGLISPEDACERYSLSMDELVSWQALLKDHGIQGLRTTRLQKYRKPGQK